MVETHFKFFKRQPSFLYKNEPEIIFDCPARISPDKNEIPVYLFIKDFEKFDFSPLNVEIRLVCKGKMLATHNFDEIAKYKRHEKYDLQGFRFSVEKPEISDERLFVYPKLKYKICEAKKSRIQTKIAAVDNINTTSKFPFSVFIASQNYPNDEKNPAKFYDLHCHSSHTNDHIEFGAPIKFIADCADFCGLNGVAICDHSYDISCKPENYLEKDENLTHWQDLQDECKENYGNIEVYLGEEISVMRNGGNAVHLGAIHPKTYVWAQENKQTSDSPSPPASPLFIHGTADGARKGYERKSEPTMIEAINSLNEIGSIVFAAHTGEIPNIFHRLFLRRDHWRLEDLQNLPKHSIMPVTQALNGKFDKTWRRARKLWVKLLLSNPRQSHQKHSTLIAGNDAHGDFNRYRAVSVPFLFVNEDFERHFAKARTGIYGENLIDAVKNGQTFISDGPYICVTIKQAVPAAEAQNPAEPKTNTANATAKITVKSSKEFGRIAKLWVFSGNCKTQKEYCIYLNLSDETYSYSQEISQNFINSTDYLRAETVCENTSGFKSFAATSAVFFNTSKDL